MVFSSLTFLYIFLPLCLIAYFIITNLTYKNIVLVIFSLFFYAWGEPKYVFLMIASAAVNYFAGLFLGKFEDKKKRKIILSATAVLNLGALVFFKYTGFILQNIGLGSVEFSIALPIGISFYTFQALSYVVDVYRGEVPPQKSFYKLLLYIVLFPQLIAGPIVRYEDVEREISDRKSTFDGISSGITRFCVGLGKKVLIANQCGEIIGKIFDSRVADTTVFGTWLGMFLFALQIFFDFSGYSDMAIGLGRVFGFNYKENFNYPYISKSATEFWRRWHMSLGSFFRDYVYIPLGGNRRHRLFNIFAVWFLTGLWHGASWNFILWGLMYGALISAEKALKKPLERLPKYLAPLSYVYMFFITVIGWTVFYFTDMKSLGSALAAMFGIGNISFTNFFVNDLFLKNIYIIVIGVFLCLPVLENLFSKLRQKNAYVSGTVEIVFNITVIFVSTVILEGSTYNPFLYFRF